MRSFTLLELIVVLIIVSILATISYVHYSGYQERSLDSEGWANLNLIIDAERVYRMERGVFFLSANVVLLNNDLRLFLPTLNAQWAYSAQLVGAICCAQATRTGGAQIRSWRLCTNGALPVSGTCNACP